jgi:hypothetical protein
MGGVKIMESSKINGGGASAVQSVKVENKVENKEAATSVSVSAKINVEVPKENGQTRQNETVINQDYWRTKLNQTLDRNLTQTVQFQQTPPATSGQTRRAEQALAEVRENLADYPLDDVDYNELRSIESTLRTLNPDELNYVLDNLSPEEWQRWGQELNEGPGLGEIIHPFHGYNGEEQQNLFNYLAQNASADNLAKMYDSLGSNPESAQRLINAIAQNSGDAVISELVGDLSSRAPLSPPMAGDLAALIGGMDDGRQIESVLLNLQENGLLDDVINGALRPETSVAGKTISLTYRAEALESFLNAAANTSNNSLKADIFALATAKLDYLRSEGELPTSNVHVGEATRQVQNGLTALLNSDTPGITAFLEQRGKGAEMTSYLQSMIESNRITEVQDLITDLLSGNQHNQTPSAFLDASVSSPTADDPHARVYQNARSLGYFLGSLHNAIGNITQNRSDQADRLNSIFGNIANAAGAFDPPAIGVVSAVLNQIAGSVTTANANAANNESWEMANGFIGMLNGLNNGSYSGPGKDAFYAAFSFYAVQN